MLMVAHTAIKCVAFYAGLRFIIIFAVVCHVSDWMFKMYQDSFVRHNFVFIIDSHPEVRPLVTQESINSGQRNFNYRL